VADAPRASHRTILERLSLGTISAQPDIVVLTLLLSFYVLSFVLFGCEY